MLADQRLFFRQYLRQFHATGAIAPSSRWLATALARYVRDDHGGPTLGPRRILEVGPGTGAVTDKIVERLGPEDQLDLVELNDDFVARLRARLASEPHLQRVAARVRVLHQPVEELPAEPRYHAIVSGLPLNNFAVTEVERVLSTLRRLVVPGGTLSFFEYVAVRPARALVSGAAERERLRGVGDQLKALLDPHEFHRECVVRNLPPAWAHHVRL